MKKEPLISVIVPCWNGEKYLEQCLGSLVCQSYKNLEIIGVDDGSRDNTLEIFKKYAAADKRIKIIAKKKNEELSAARNTGIDAARGEYIHFMDSDDYVPLDFYEKMAAAAVTNDADMSAGGISSNFSLSLTFDSPFILTSLYEKIYVLQCAKYGFVWRYLFRRKFIEDNKFRFIVGRNMEDAPFVLAAVKAANKIAVAPNANYYYLKHPGSILSNRSHAHRKRMNADKAWAKEMILKFLADNNLPSYLRKEKITIQKIRLFGLIRIGKIITKSEGNRKEFRILGVPLFKTKKISTNEY